PILHVVFLSFQCSVYLRALHSFPTRRTSCAGDAFLRCTRNIVLSVTLELLLRRCAAPWSRTRTIRTMQTELNTYSLALALVLVTLGMTLVLIMAAWHSGSEKGLRHWA